VKDDPYQEMAFKLDALLTAEFGAENLDLKYIDVSTPEVLEYINDVSNIVEGRLPFPYITVNETPLCWGVADMDEVTGRVKEKLE
jgi:disulfide oxidoreductase YuzD